MSSSALQVAKTATYLPDLVEVQRASFKSRFQQKNQFKKNFKIELNVQKQIT